MFKYVSDLTADHHGDNLIALLDAEHFLKIISETERQRAQTGALDVFFLTCSNVLMLLKSVLFRLSKFE